MPPLLSQALYERVRDLLLTPALELNRVSRRDEVLTDAFYYRLGGLYTSIAQGGTVTEFVSQLLRKLDDYGCFEGRHPVTCLLESLERFEGPEMQSKIHQLIQEINPICLQRTTENEDNYFLPLTSAVEGPLLTHINSFGRNYRLIQDGLIERDKYWEIWKAYEAAGTTGRTIAIKFISNLRLIDEGISFGKEISLIAQLEHPHIIPTYDWDSQKQAFIVTRLLTGGSLHSRMARALSKEVILRYIGQLARALQYAHAVGVVHGNLKPENILFDDKIDHPYIANFGIARNLVLLMPTNDYAAPEQRLGQLTEKSDQYTLGLIAYEMLAREFPFSETNREFIRPIDTIELSGSVYKVLSRACSSDPGDRFPNVLAFADALQSAIEFDEEGSSQRDEEQLYLADLVKECQLKIRGYVGLAGTKRQNPLLSPAHTARTGAGRVVIRHAMLYQAQRSISESPSEPTDDVRETILKLERIVLLGEPGSGKTTTLLQIALDCAAKAQTDPQAPVPVFVPLTLFQGDIPFEDFVRQQMGAIAHRLVNYQDDPGRLLLIFDALNETLQDNKKDVISYLSLLPRFIVSCRTKDYQQELSSLDNLATVSILDLDPYRIRRALQLRLDSRGQLLWNEIGGGDQLLKFWDALVSHDDQSRFWFLGKVPSYTTDETDRAWMRMHDRAVFPLCRNPFMLTMICDLYEHQGQIPANRGELFEQFTNACIDSEIERIAGVEGWRSHDERYSIYKTLILDGLAVLAREIQLQKLGTGIGRDNAQEILAEKEGKGYADLMLTLARDSGLITISHDQILFSHQLIQEYFASEILGRAMDNDPPIPASSFFKSESWWKPQGWEETAIILAGVRGKGEINKVVRWIAEAQPELALRCIEQCGIPGVTLESIDSGLREWLQKQWTERMIDQRELSKARAVVGRSLGKIGDPRSGVGLRRHKGQFIPDIYWCDVRNQPFYISKFPITHSQFRSFIEAEDGYSQSAWWNYSNESDQWHRQHADPIKASFEDPNYPRVDVSWFEALAFCSWLSHRLKEQVRLPSEIEWKYAVLGTTQAGYPWGETIDKQHANVSFDDENSLNQASPVGIFPMGKAFCTAEDMIGNVWEWCNDIFQSFPKPEETQPLCRSTTRVLKGGSWFYSSPFARCDYRFWAFPSYRNKDIGFRIVKLIGS